MKGKEGCTTSGSSTPMPSGLNLTEPPTKLNFTVAGSTLWEFHPHAPGSFTPREFHPLGVPPPSSTPLPPGSSTPGFHSGWIPPSFILPGSSTLLGVPPLGSSTPLGIPPLLEFHSSGVSFFWEFDLLGVFL